MGLKKGESNIAIEVIGWIGTVLILSAFALNIEGYVDAQRWPSLTMNMFGAAGIGANALYHRTYPAAAVEIAWVFIAIAGLVRFVAVQ